MVMVVDKVFFGHIICQLASGYGSGGQAGIHTGLIQSQRIEGGKHTDIRENRNIVFSMLFFVLCYNSE